MDFDAMASEDAFARTYLNQGATVTFELQNLIRSLVNGCEYSLPSLSKLFKPFVRYRGNNI